MSETTYEMKEMSFNLHKQDPSKKKKPTSPDFFGSVKLQAFEYQLSGWARINGDKVYVSGSVYHWDNDKAVDDGKFELNMVTDKKNPDSPDYRGSVTINKEQFSLSGWMRTAKFGGKYIKGSVRDGNEVNHEPATVEQVDDFFGATAKEFPDKPQDEVANLTSDVTESALNQGPAVNGDDLPF